MKRRNPLPRRQLAREPIFSKRMMAIARSVSKDEPGGLELRATLVAEALKMRKLELSNPSPLAGEDLPCGAGRMRGRAALSAARAEPPHRS